MVDPLVHHDVVDCWSLGRVIIQDLRDDVTSGVRDTHTVWEIVGVHTDSLVGSLHIRCLEGRLTNNKRVNDDSDRPDVDLVGVTLLALEHLGSDVVGSTANGTLPLSIELKLGGETKITDLDLHLVVEEQITELQISVNDAMTVQILDSGTDLVNVALNLELVKALSATEQLIQRLVLTELKQDVHVLSVFKEVLEAYDVVLVERSVNLDLRHELLLGSSLRESRFGNDFGRRDSFIFEVGELEAASETSLTEELALQVLLDADLSIVLDDFLFDDGLSAIDSFLLMSCLHFFSV